MNVKTIAFGALFAGVAVLLAACEETPRAAGTASVEQRRTETNQQRLITTQPAPILSFSQERANLIERLSRINQQNMTGCIYLISYGHVMAFYPVRGKVTSLNAYLTGAEQIVDASTATGSAFDPVLIEQPDLDGAYGQNVDGVFFFTADTNAYVEWRGEYLWSDQCLGLFGQQPALVREVPAN